MKKDLTTGTPWKIVLFFALPIMAGNLLQQLYNTADTIIVGNFLGEAALSAVGTCASLTLLFTALAIGFSGGAGVYLAQKYGAKKIDELRLGVSTSIIVMLAMGLAATIVGAASCDVILKHAMAVPESFLNMAIGYFTVYSIGLFFQFGYNIIAAILRSIGDSKATLYFLLVSSVMNIILDLLFVAVFKFGVVGAAIATDISQLCSFLFALIYMFKRYEMLHFKKSEFKYNGRVAKTVLGVGLPMAIQQVIVSSGFVFLQRLVNSYGEAMTASYTVASRIENYTFIPTAAFQNTMATYCGQNKGAGYNDRIAKGVRQTVIMSAAVSIFLSALLLIFKSSVIGLFAIKGEAAALCNEHLSFMCMVFFLFAVYFPANGMLQGVGEGFYATLCALTALGSRVLFAYTLSAVNAIGYKALWYSSPLAWLLVLAVCYFHIARGKWKQVSLK